MTIEDLEVCFRVENPQAVAYFRRNGRDGGKYWMCELSELQNLDHGLKNLAINTYKKFTQAVLFVSGKEYLDSITLNSDCLLFPNKVYKLLSTSKHIAKEITEHLELQTPWSEQQDRRVKNPQLQPCAQRSFQLLGEIIQKVQKNILTKIKLNIKYKTPPEQPHPSTLLNQFNYYWKHCTEQQKQSIWYLGYHDVKKAAMKTLDLDSIKIDVNQIEEYVLMAQKMGMRELGGRIFSWKLGRVQNGVVQYMRLVFDLLKERTRKKCGQSPKQKNKRTKKKKTPERTTIRQSMDQSSNQTNQTDIIYQNPYDINIDDLLQTKLQRDLYTLADNLNEQSNLYYENRVLSFRRLKEILGGVGCELKLYGSCCVGLAVRDSDVDVTVGEGVLEAYYAYYGGALQSISAFFQSLEYYFANFPWISNIRVIKSATIPIIKFTIDNRIPYNTSTLGYCLETDLNQLPQHTNPVQFDLTVQTTDPSRRHLGIASTQQTVAWLTQIPTLQPIAIIIKKQLADNMVNETYYGGLNTYTLLVLIVALVRKEKLGKEERLGVVMERVLRFYSEVFQEDRFGVDLGCPGIFYDKAKEIEQGTKTNIEVDKDRQLQVKDPQGDHRIMTKNCYQFKKIKKLLSDLYNRLFTIPRLKVQQICSAWNPKENPLDQDSLLEWVEKRMKESEDVEMLRVE